MTRMAPGETGTVYLVGAGPGAPDLLTLRAASLLASANVVFHDALVNPEIVALAVRATKVEVGKRCGRHSTAQRFINKRLVDAAFAHRVVVRLKGGDPMLFGRAQEEIDALVAAGIRVEVVPGITAALAASAELRTSMTQRGVARSVAFVTPRVGELESASDWVHALAAADTGAVYMGAGQANAVSTALLAAGKRASTPVAVVTNATLPNVHAIFTTIGELGGLDLTLDGGPAMILIGDQFVANTHRATLGSAAPLAALAMKAAG